MCQCKNICGIISYNNQGARFDDCSIRQMDCQNCKKERIFLICRLNKGFYFMLQNIQSTKRFGWISLKGSNSNFSFLEAYDFTQAFFEIVQSLMVLHFCTLPHTVCKMTLDQLGKNICVPEGKLKNYPRCAMRSSSTFFEICAILGRYNIWIKLHCDKLDCHF